MNLNKILIILPCIALFGMAQAGESIQYPGFVYCENGRLYHPDGKELSLWGVNFQPYISWEYDYYMKKVGIPRDPAVWKRMTDQGFDELERMNCQVVRYQITPADFTDAEGNLVETFYLDMLDYAVAEAASRGIYVYLTLLNHMHLYEVKESFMEATWQKGRSVDEGKAWWYQQANLMLNRKYVECSQNYIRQLLNRYNPYSRRSYNEDRNIVLIEITNEPLYLPYDMVQKDEHLYGLFRDWLARRGLEEMNGIHYPEYRKQAVLNYLNEMHGVIRDAGAKQPIAWSCNWHRMITRFEDVFEAIAESRVEVVTFCNYPGQDKCKAPYLENPVDLTRVDFSDWFAACYHNRDWYGWMLEERFRDKARIAYEFETFYNQSAYLYPAQAKLFRSLGAQMACMWHYLMPDYAQYVNGSHMLHLKCTPRKAASFAVAGALFNSQPLYEPYPKNSTVEDVSDNYMFSYEKDLSIFSGGEKYFYSNAVTGREQPGPGPGVREIMGWSDSPLVKYDGTGVYTVSVSEHQVSITIEPDYKWVKEPWQRDLYTGIVTELDHHAEHEFELKLGGWEAGHCEVFRMEDGYKVKQPLHPDKLKFSVRPGKYMISKKIETEE